MLKQIINIILFSFIIYSCTQSYSSLQDPINYEKKYFRNFSFVYQSFSEPIKNEIIQKFCYKVYYNKITLKKTAFEFINEDGKIEFIGYFNNDEKIEKIDAIDNSRGRMNMEFIYNDEKKISVVNLYDDEKKLFSKGNVSYSDKGRLILISFSQNDINNSMLFYMIRSDNTQRDIEIATYSASGTVFSNHLYFYDNEKNLRRYEFYRKLKFEIGLIFLANGQIKKIDNIETLHSEENNSDVE